MENLFLLFLLTQFCVFVLIQAQKTQIFGFNYLSLYGNKRGSDENAHFPNFTNVLPDNTIDRATTNFSDSLVLATQMDAITFSHLSTFKN